MRKLLRTQKDTGHRNVLAMRTPFSPAISCNYNLSLLVLSYFGGPDHQCIFSIYSTCPLSVKTCADLCDPYTTTAPTLKDRELGSLTFWFLVHKEINEKKASGSFCYTSSSSQNSGTYPQDSIKDQIPGVLIVLSRFKSPNLKSSFC